MRTESPAIFLLAASLLISGLGLIGEQPLDGKTKAASFQMDGNVDHCNLLDLLAA